jgi:hypothetical protein
MLVSVWQETTLPDGLWPAHGNFHPLRDFNAGFIFEVAPYLHQIMRSRWG